MKSNLVAGAVIIVTALLVGAHEYFRVTTLFHVHLPTFLKNETQNIAVQLGDSLAHSDDLANSDIPIEVFPSISVRIEMKRSNQVRTIAPTNSHVAPPPWFNQIFMQHPIEYQMSFYNESEKRATIYTTMIPNALLREVWNSYICGIILFAVLYLVVMRLFAHKERVIERLVERLLVAMEQAKDGGYQHQLSADDPTLVKRVLNAFNNMSETNLRRIKLLEQERDKFEALTQHDALTGLANKQCFHNLMKKRLRDKDGVGGHILLLKLASLEQINIQLGHQEGDIYISRMANVLNKLCNFKQVSGEVFRNLGSEMLVVISNADSTTIDFLAEELKSYLDKLENDSYQNGCGYFSIIEFKPGQKLSELMTLLDCNLSQAMAKYHNAYVIADSSDEVSGGLNHWYRRISDFIRDKNVVLQRHLIRPVSDDFQSYQYEINACFKSHGESYEAKEVFAAASRFDLSHKLDQLVVTKLVEYMDEDGEQDVYALQISSDSVASERFRNWVSHLLSHHLKLAKRLVFQIPETVVVEHLESSRLFINAAHKVGARVILDCQQSSDAFELTEHVKALAIDMVKVSGPENQPIVEAQQSSGFIKTLVSNAHDINVPVIAGQVENSQVWEFLNTLGVDAGQGHLFGRPVIFT
ncbi:EAL domain-containing protein [Psychrobium sp. MM17-31]|uniref:EAL domain-containing protein n=1 Tax=Psychrobium sp. MM17-31 TaxID=2917758 RepID=UPI001EF5CB8B|nr:EAL domain-containing protein [Psychrobium sp. MM17-31]MCG7531403.1 EAL domain-containing protein [Psychrobium sp. MM17-31]